MLNTFKTTKRFSHLLNKLILTEIATLITFKSELKTDAKDAEIAFLSKNIAQTCVSAAALKLNYEKLDIGQEPISGAPGHLKVD